MAVWKVRGWGGVGVVLGVRLVPLMCWRYGAWERRLGLLVDMGIYTQGLSNMDLLLCGTSLQAGSAVCFTSPVSIDPPLFA